MEPILWMAVGAGIIVGLIVARLAAKHGWAWVASRLKAHAAAAEADFKAKVSAAAGDFIPRLEAVEAKVKAAIETDIATIKTDIAALKSKVGV